MGQAKRRGSYEDRLSQALAANAEIETELHDGVGLYPEQIPILKRLMLLHGVQKFRMSVGRHSGKTKP